MYGFITSRKLLTGLDGTLAARGSFWEASNMGGTAGTGTGDSISDVDFFRRLKKDDGFLVRVGSFGAGAGGASRDGGVCCVRIWLTM